MLDLLSTYFDILGQHWRFLQVVFITLEVVREGMQVLLLRTKISLLWLASFKNNITLLQHKLLMECELIKLCCSTITQFYFIIYTEQPAQLMSLGEKVQSHIIMQLQFCNAIKIIQCSYTIIRINK